MIPFVLAMAFAAVPVDPTPDGIPPQPESVDAVTAIDSARPFELVEPTAYRMRGDQPLFERGWLLRLQVEPGMARSRQVDQPVLYIGEWPARVLNRSETRTCLVAWAPASAPIEETPVYFGSRLLPERVDADRAAAELAAARQAGAIGRAPATTEPALVGIDIDKLWEAASAEAARCATP